ncbi:CDP-alcohol phosphatidyltransferase family protein [Candidatus Phytoplasma phoenicium]|uniref:CDP-diacylglycerol-serine O-phosphatidyltransferase n=1 Tax=Candidatus Phytoplasma phoenicium TaxID=198422 RepID=A0A0L0MJP9_9MOLU|nr:CDP-alcohol phosphatidyltransferase family protein [Candidatus Phytoplasma phoenicium]KND62511.1 CDP-diacylglycerol-serine O-phosphatidyltransferase [Candidatus Phytoplasma phoenicium]
MFLGIYNYTTYLTYLNLLSGVFGISFLMNKQINISYATICLLISGFLDMFDGVISRLKKNHSSTEKEYGVQIDSLADMISFGLLPILIGWVLFIKTTYINDKPLAYLFWFFAGLYSLTALIRLAYFNVLAKKEENFENQIFIGIPVTVSSIIFPLLILSSQILKKQWPNEIATINKYSFVVYFAMIILLSILFVFNKIKFKKQKNIIYFLSITLFLITLIFGLIIFKF